MSNVAECIAKFNSSIKFLARVYALKKKGTFEEEKAMRTNKRLSMIIASYPAYMLEASGPFFLKYAKFIHEKNWDELMEQDFSEEKEAYGSTDDGKKHSGNSMDGKIRFIKRVFLDSDERERDRLGGAMATLLSCYCEYVLIIKNQ